MEEEEEFLMLNMLNNPFEARRFINDRKAAKERKEELGGESSTEELFELTKRKVVHGAEWK